MRPAHDLPTFPDGHKCRRLHGHSFRFDVIVEGAVDPAKGYLIDYGDIKKAAEPLVKRLDHYYLNEIEGIEQPDQREHRQMDLGPAQARPADAGVYRRTRDLHLIV